MRAHSPNQGGFSLIELLISLAAFALVLAGLLVLFDNSALLARAQTQVAVLQQSQRVANADFFRFVRAAGLGGLPVTTLNIPDADNNGVPDWMEAVTAASYDDNPVFPEHGLALSVIDNVQGLKSIRGVVDTSVADCNPTADNDCVLPGSDVLIVRGVFTTPLYYFDPPIDLQAWLADDNALVNQSITVRGKFRFAGKITNDYPQDLATLSETLERARVAGLPEAFILRDTLNPNTYVVMEFDAANTTAAELMPVKCPQAPAGVSPDEVPLCMTFRLRLDNTATDPTDPYAALSSGSLIWGTPGPALGTVRLPATVGSFGLLEEYRFFIRVKWQDRPGLLPDRLTPVLSRARFRPGNVLVGPIVDIAENVVDLQIAVGVESDEIGSGPGYGQILEGTAGNPSPRNDDEILFNHPGDHNAATGVYAPPPGHAAWFDTDLGYTFLRINTLVESAEPERGYQAPLVGLIENFDRGQPFALPGSPEPTVNYNSEDRRRYRRRWLRTVVELRNLL